MKLHDRTDLGRTPGAPLGLILWTMIFSDHNKFTQDFSDKGSNFILSLLEVGP